MPMRIIVNADDLGMSDSVNQAIFEGLRRGVITSATLLANGPAVQSAVRELQRFPQYSFGVHLNLTEFEPLWGGSRADLNAILDKKGRFNGNSIREVRIGIPMRGAIFREWCCQIESLMRLGVEPSHFDAHHHVHTIPRLLPVMAALRRRYKINKVRISRNLYDASERPGRLLLEKKRLFNMALRVIGFRTTRIFTDLSTYIKLCAANQPESETAELMAHPDASQRTDESVLLGSDWTQKLSYQTALINYKSL